MKVFLIGFMGVGKSSVAAAIHRKYGYRVVEMDEMIVRQEGMSIPEIFEKKGEPYFRGLETRLLRDIKEMDDEKIVVSCGGGVPMRPENVELIRQSGELILLTAKPETILERVRRNNNRPLLRGKKNVQSISEMMEQRRPAYEAAATGIVSVDGKNPDILAKEIVEGMTR